MWSFYFSMPPEILLHPAVPTLSPYLRPISSTETMIQSLIWLLCYNIFCLLVACILLHLHLVSRGLCSCMYLSIFSYRSEVRVDTNTELVVPCMTLVLVARYRAWHCLNSCTILHLSRCSTSCCFSLHLWLRPDLPLLS